MNFKKLIAVIPAVLCITLFSCIDLNQVTHINEDGSGFINIRYSTKLANLSMGDELGDFAFSEHKAREFLSSPGNDVRELKLERNESDSTVGVIAVINFKDFNKLNTSRTFSKFSTVWERAGDEFRFTYALSKDSVAGINFGPGDNKFHYEFNFPGEIISSNGNSSGYKAVWKYEFAQAAKGFEMQARVKAPGGLSSLLNYKTLIIIVIVFLAFITFRNIRKRRQDK